LLYGSIICGVIFFSRRTFARGTWVLVFLFVFISNLVVETKKENRLNAFWIFHKHNESVLGHQMGGMQNYHTSHEENSLPLLTDFTNSRLIKKKRKLLLKNSYVQKGFSLLLLKEVHLSGMKQIAPTHILLQKNIKLNLDLLLEDYKPKLIVADGSNAPWFAKRWEKSCAKYKVPFHDTRKMGALKITLESEE
jgi:competence protein ComEC